MFYIILTKFIFEYKRLINKQTRVESDLTILSKFIVYNPIKLEHV